MPDMCSRTSSELGILHASAFRNVSMKPCSTNPCDHERHLPASVTEADQTINLGHEIGRAHV